MTRDKGDDETRSMAILHNIVDHSIEPERVKAAWMIASCLSSGGTFENTIGENIINEAIDAYGRVVFFIALGPNYPRATASTKKKPRWSSSPITGFPCGCESRMAVMASAWFIEFRQRLPWLLHVD